MSTAPVPGTAADEEPPGLRPLGWTDLLKAVAGLALAVVLIAYGLPYFLETSWAEIWAQLSRVSLGPAIAMAVLLVAGLFCYTWVLIGSLPGLGHVQALKANAVSSLVANVLPLGAAVGVALQFLMFRSWGFRKREISTSMMVTGRAIRARRFHSPVTMSEVEMSRRRKPQERNMRNSRAKPIAAPKGSTLATREVTALALSPWRWRRPGSEPVSTHV